MGRSDNARWFERNLMSVPIHEPIENGRTLSFHYGEERIQFVRVPRREDIERVLIKVHPSCQVEVAAPAQAQDEEVVAAVKKRGRWVWQQLLQFREQLEHVTPKKYVSGESLRYLGKQYLLKVVQDSEVSEGVKLSRGKLEVTVDQPDTERVQKLLSAWYKTRAKEIFARRLDAILEQALWVQERPPLRVQVMRTQWGSCSPGGRITLNPWLVKAPRECVDYVILHELCHIAEHNHSERFYRLLGQVMPGWQRVKDKLDGMAVEILNG
jgi:predicted metal-dependent hydrolase